MLSPFGMADTLGVANHRVLVTPAELDGAAVRGLGALHGTRIVTEWMDGPDLDEQPGRLAAWRDRRDVLLKPIGVVTP